MNPSSTATRRARPARPGFQISPAGRWTAVAGAAYVTAWIVGLMVAPSAPASTASAAQVHAYYADSTPAILLQSFLVHGLAGFALAVLALAIPRATGATRTMGRAVTGFGFAAAVISFVQVAFGIAATQDVESAAATTSQSLFHAINVADTVKIFLLTGFVTAATLAAHRAGIAPHWLRLLTQVLVILLPLGGAAFLIDSPVLTATLYVSLPLLLIWTGGTALIVGWRARQATRPGT